MIDTNTLANGFVKLFAHNIDVATSMFVGKENFGGAFVGGSRRFIENKFVPESSDLDVFVWVSSLPVAEESLREAGFVFDNATFEYENNVSVRYLMQNPETRNTMIDMHVFENHDAFVELKEQHDKVETWAKYTAEGKAFIEFMSTLMLSGNKPKGSGKNFFRHMLARASANIE